VKPVSAVRFGQDTAFLNSNHSAADADTSPVPILVGVQPLAYQKLIEGPYGLTDKATVAPLLLAEGKITEEWRPI
jgi:hypothetical protein